MESRTTKLSDRSRCIEDRTFIGAEEGELNQVPGADIFFSYAKDILATLNGQAVNHTLEDAVLADISNLGEDYTVHNDEGHGDEYDGCGFAARIAAISSDLVTYSEEVIAGSNLNETESERAPEIIKAVGITATEFYFGAVGGELVRSAAENGATVITYTGEHTASEASDDEEHGTTYDSIEANNPATDTKPRFNLDSNHAANRAKVFGLDPEDTKILAKLLATATVRVLSDGAITELQPA